jgi:hypothetical protein
MTDSTPVATPVNSGGATPCRRGVTVIELAIVALALLLAVAGARFGWERWHYLGSVLGAVCGFIAGIPIGGLMTLISVASVLFVWPYNTDAAPASPSQLQVEKIGCGVIITATLLAGLIGWNVWGIPGGICGLLLGVPATTAVFALVVRIGIWIAGALRRR